jgi:shikimate dehydrogenase
MKLDQPDSRGLFPLVQILPMVGNPVEENPIDLLFNRFFDQAGAAYRFVKFRVESAEDLGACVEGARKMGFAAMAFTVPYKMASVRYCDEIVESSQGVGAVNFITFEGPERRAVGKNTDGIAICSSIRQKIPIEGRRFLILGAGGAARGIGAEIARQGAASITIAARNPAKGLAVADALRPFGGPDFTTHYQPWQGPLSITEGTDIVLNATSVGAFPEQGALDLDWNSLAKATMAVDVITGPRNTHFLKQAHALNLLTVDGVDMLIDIVHVGLESFGVTVPREAIETYARTLSGPSLG